MAGPHSPTPPANAPQPAETPGIRVHGRLLVAESSLRFDFARSSGPGGQNVNKRSTKCQMRVALADVMLREEELQRFVGFAGGLVTASGEALFEADEFRSQAQNKEACVERLRQLLAAALVRPKVRKKTRPTRGSVERRIREKKQRGQTKRHRSDGGE